MRDEGAITIQSRRYGLLAFLRRKQWWSFEGLDPQQKLYFVFLALQAFPSDYVSLKVIDYGSGHRAVEEYLGSFRASAGDSVDVAAEGQWGRLSFRGRAELGWQVEAQTASLRAQVFQRPESPPHRDWLLTRNLDYTIQQFAAGRTEGLVRFEGQERPFSGHAYHEHAWGVQPRHSTARWLHFWGTDLAGVILNCSYDSGVPHHYTYLWYHGQEYRLYSPAHFTYDPAVPEAPWQVRSPDLELRIRPLTVHQTRTKIPPWPAYIDIDYHEQLLEVDGMAWVQGHTLSVHGLGKMDFNWNRW